MFEKTTIGIYVANAELHSVVTFETLKFPLLCLQYAQFFYRPSYIMLKIMLAELAVWSLMIISNIIGDVQYKIFILPRETQLQNPKSDFIGTRHIKPHHRRRSTVKSVLLID